jgi:DNA repair exonuclease SbcCD ATPase subunit
MQNQLSRAGQELEKERRNLELRNDNIMILQNDLQKMSQEQTQLMTKMQAELGRLAPQEGQARQNLVNAQATFKRAQESYEQAQMLMQKAQDVSQKAQEKHQKEAGLIAKNNTTQVTVLESKMHAKQNEILRARADLSRAESAVREYTKKVELEQQEMMKQMRKATTSNSNHAPDMRKRA